METTTAVRYGLYVRGRKVHSVHYPGRFHWEGKRGWYVRVLERDHNTGTTKFVEKIVSMIPCFGRLKWEARSATVETWETRERAEAVGFEVVMRHPEWIGLLEVREYEDRR